MNCHEAARLLNAHFDGELDLATSLGVDEHLEGCARCRQALAGLHAARAAIARHAAMPPAPEALRRSVAQGIGETAGTRLRSLLRSPLAVAAPGLAALALAVWLLLGGSLREPAAAQRVVYHISSSETARATLRNLANHMRAAPEVKVVVVAHNNGVDFLLSGARDETGQPFEAAVREFGQRGVEFRVCTNTLERRGIPAAQLIPQARLVPSGIAEIGRLQSREGYAYMRL